MKLLLLEPDVDFSRILGSLLGKSDIHVHHAPTVEEAKAAFQQMLYDLAIFAVPAELEELEALLSHVRAHPAGTTLPIVLMSDVWSKSDPRMTHLVRVQKCQEFLARPFSMLGLADRLRTVAQSGPIDTSGESKKSTEKPDHRVLRLFKEIWHEQKTGVLRLENSSDWALFLDGCTTNTAATDLARKGLYQGSVTFQETNQSGSKDGSFYPMLWEAVLATVKTTFLLQRKTTWAAPAAMYARISEFPVSESTRDLVSDSTATIPLEDLLGDEPSVPRELAALADLKIIVFQPVEKTVKPKQTTRIPLESPIAEEASPPSIPPASDDPQQAASIRGGRLTEPAKESSDVVHKRLKREWDALANADHYTVLGASPKTDVKVLEGLASRMNKRYSDIAQDEDQPDQIRELAKKILARVHEAENLVVGRKRVVGALPTEQPQELTKEDLAFREGQTAMESGLYTRAIQCFTLARNERLDSARNLAWLGWAVYQNEEQPIKERCEEALDFLRLASSFDPHHREGQYFLAFIESKHGLLEQAQLRLLGLVQDDPGNTLARTLLNNVRKDLS